MQEVGDATLFLTNVYQRLNDIAVNECISQNHHSSLVSRYVTFKETFDFEMYLKSIKNSKYRMALSRLRLCSNNLKVNLVCRKLLDTDQQKCDLCNLEQTENEHHFVMNCPFYANLRQQFLPTYYLENNSDFHFRKLMSLTKNEDLMFRLGKFTFLAMEKRKRFYLAET